MHSTVVEILGWLYDQIYDLLEDFPKRGHLDTLLDGHEDDSVVADTEPVFSDVRPNEEDQSNEKWSPGSEAEKAAEQCLGESGDWQQPSSSDSEA